MKHLPKIRRELETNVVYCADNLEVMRQLPTKSIHLIYIDPPFGTNSLKKSKTWDKQVQGLSFYDSSGGGIKTYVSFMADRLEQMYRILKPNGILCVHLDWRSVHYIKCKLDEIFGQGSQDRGRKHLVNEIIWYYGGNSNPKKMMPRKHDTILVYTKSKKFNHTFNKYYLPYKESTLKRYNHTDSKGRRYKVSNLKKKKNINDPDDIVYMKEGNPLQDVWTNIPVYRRKGRTQYPTEKHPLLLERLIYIFTKEGNIVADFFCGCGTTLSAAQKLGRQWLGVDANIEASKEIRKRMAKDHSMTVDITPLKNLKKSEVLKLPPLEFEKYCVRCAGGVPNERQVGDGGIDGKLIRDGTPIQVKKSHKVGRPVIDAFHKHFKRNGRGIIIALSFSKCAKEEVHGLKVDEGKDLKLITLDTLLKKGTGVAA